VNHSLQPDTTTLVRTVERARNDMGVAMVFRASVTIGGRFGLWGKLLFICLPRIHRAVRGIAIREEMAFEDELIQGLVEGRIHIGVMYTPQKLRGLLALAGVLGVGAGHLLHRKTRATGSAEFTSNRTSFSDGLDASSTWQRADRSFPP
jgi:DNA-binding transcriptional LysR family regulator